MDTQDTVRNPSRRAAPQWPAAADPADHGLHGPAAGRNWQAVAAMATGLTALLTSTVVVGGLLGVPGLVLGISGWRTARRTGVGHRQAVSGVVASAVAITVSVVAALIAVWFAHKTQGCYQFNRIRQWTQCVHQHVDLG